MNHLVSHSDRECESESLFFTFERTYSTEHRKAQNKIIFSSSFLSWFSGRKQWIELRGGVGDLNCEANLWGGPTNVCEYWKDKIYETATPGRNLADYGEWDGVCTWERMQSNRLICRRAMGIAFAASQDLCQIWQ
jgi:hypothetical protein